MEGATVGVVGEPGSGVAGAVDDPSSVGTLDVVGLANSGAGERRVLMESSEGACFSGCAGLFKSILAFFPMNKRVDHQVLTLVYHLRHQ